MDTTKPQKQPKTCHDCGLEAIDECETGQGHFPYDQNAPPCKFCERNFKTENIVTDFYSENWTLASDKTPMFDDLTPRDKALLGLLKYAKEFYGDV
jgi:hypothetical protein